ncbi:DUF3010 family protein [Lysobacter niabensis]|uniref:DUF3010 family protein n=1 Tax=Agrilutibacter niabensis TaxID=380628 RepID=UPI003610CAD0
MIVCGISIASSEAALVWVDTGAKQLVGSAKVSLADPYDRDDLARTGELVRQLLVERKTGLVVVRKSSVSGKFGAGHVAFRLETIIAISAPCNLEFVSSQSVAAFVKREVPDMPESLRKYQHEAFLAAISRI